MGDGEFTVLLPQKPWYGDTWCEIGLPSTWDVTVCAMPGQDRRRMTREEMQASFARPIGMPRISALARGKREVDLG